MSGGAKLAIGITVLVVLYIVWDWFSKKSEEEKKKKEAEENCIKTASDLEYKTIKTEKARRISGEYTTLSINYVNAHPNNWSQPSIAAENPIRKLTDEYRMEAITKGGIIPNTNYTEYHIRAYAYNILAEKEMAADGYCKRTVGYVNVYPGEGDLYNPFLD